MVQKAIDQTASSAYQFKIYKVELYKKRANIIPLFSLFLNEMSDSLLKALKKFPLD